MRRRNFGLPRWLGIKATLGMRIFNITTLRASCGLPGYPFFDPLDVKVIEEGSPFNLFDCDVFTLERSNQLDEGWVFLRGSVLIYLQQTSLNLVPFYPSRKPPLGCLLAIMEVF